MFRSEIGSGFEDLGGTPPPRIPRSTPPPPGLSIYLSTYLSIYLSIYLGYDRQMPGLCPGGGGGAEVRVCRPRQSASRNLSFSYFDRNWDHPRSNACLRLYEFRLSRNFSYRRSAPFSPFNVVQLTHIFEYE